MNRFRARVWGIGLLWMSWHEGAFCGTLTLPADKRPAWLERDGIVMAGSWEPRLFRVRRDGSPGYKPTPEQRAAYAREHSPEMVSKLKALGVNFVMMHAYKGFGLEAEHESMADAVRFARLCHAAGLRVGVYNYSGTLGWELFYQEHPEARDWVVLNQNGQPVTYGSSRYRYYWNRNRPDAQAFYRGLIRFAVWDIRADLIHFDNYVIGPGFDTYSVRQFRKYLGKTFSSRERRNAGLSDLNAVRPPTNKNRNDLLWRAWQDFSCRSLADSYHDMSRYAHRLRSNMLVEANPGGPDGRIRPPVDHGRMLPGGEAFWDESRVSGYRGGVLHSRIRTYKVGRSFNNIAFAYTRTPLEAAEAMAFNLDCLGCVCWFEYGNIVKMPGSTEPMSTNLFPYIRFFNTHRGLFRDTAAIADVAVLRSFPSQVFAEAKWPKLTGRVEEALIENRVPFQIIYDSELTKLRRYRAVVLAGCVAMSDLQIKLLKRYVASGRCLCVIGPVATHDEWFRPRTNPGLCGVRPDRIAQFSENDDYVAAVRQSCGGRFSLSVSGPSGLCADLAEQGGRRLVHLVNYRSDTPATNVVVNLLLSDGKTAKSVQLSSPEHADCPNLVFQQHSDILTFTVPRTDVYEVAVVQMR